MAEKYFTVTAATTQDDLKKQRANLLFTEKLHPDHGGSNDEFVEIERQYQLALSAINVFHVFGKADASGRQFLYDLIDGIAFLLQENKKFPEWSISVGVNMAKQMVNQVDATKWTAFIMKIINIINTLWFLNRSYI